MRATVLSILTMTLVVDVATGIGFGRRGGGFGFRPPFSPGFGGDPRCPDPSPIIRRVTEITCCVESCANYVANCSEALKPPVRLCEFRERCEPDVRLVMSILREPGINDPAGQIMTMVAECFASNLMNSMGLEYIPGDERANAIAVLNATRSSLGSAADAVIRAVEDDTCTPPELRNFSVENDIGFHVCLMKVCVETMASQAPPSEEVEEPSTDVAS